MSLKQSRKDANPASNLMTEHGMDIMNLHKMDQIHI
jgi:hypothetical protein